MRISRKNGYSILIILAELIPVLVLMIISLSKDVSSTMHSIGIIALICFVMSFIAIWRSCKELNAFVYFLIFEYLFSFGQCYMAIVGQELKNSTFALSRGFFTSDAIVHSAIFVLISIMATCIGYLIYGSRRSNVAKEERMLNEQRYAYRTERARKTGWVFLIIGIVPTFINLYQEYRSMVTLGYASTLVAATGTTRILGLIAGFFMSGLLLLFCYEKKHRKIIYLIAIAYVVAQLAGGSRIQIFRIAIVFLMIEDLYFKKMDRHKWLMVIGVGILAMLGLSLISSVRNYLYLSSDIGGLIRSSFDNLWKNNFMIAAINEMGNTQVINTLVLDTCPNPMPFQFGLSFIKMLWAIIPNFIGAAYTGYIGVDLTFSPLYTVTNAGMGASYISEGYWNFGYLSLLYFVGFGMLFGMLTNKFRKMCEGKNIDPGKFFLVVYVIYYALFLVRSEALGFGRSFVYYAFIPYACINIRGGTRRISR